MSGATLYDDLVMDHIKNARNYRALEPADRQATGINPLCGDEMVVYVRMSGDRIADVAFQCTCCGISMASASIMTETVKGKYADEAKALSREFVATLDSRAESAARETRAERLAMLDTIKKFPSRTRCAALPWATLEAALDQQEAVLIR